MKDAELTAEERLAELFQPDVLLPTQFFDRLRRRSEHDGERRLMVAVLEDAEAWIESPDRTWLFSFENICDVLGIDADYLRRGLREWKARMAGGRGRVVPLRASVDEQALRRVSGD